MLKIEEQPSKGVLRKKCSENMQQIYRRTPPKPKCGFNNVADGGVILLVQLQALLKVTLLHE